MGRAGRPCLDGKSKEGSLEEVAFEPMKGQSVIWAGKGEGPSREEEQQVQRITLNNLGLPLLGPRELGSYLTSPFPPMYCRLFLS